jgi:hypothetical protein
MQVNEKRLNQLLLANQKGQNVCPINDDGEEANCAEYKTVSGSCVDCWKAFLQGNE